MHCFLRRQHSDRETDEEAIKTAIYGPLTSDQVVLLNVVDMHGVESYKRCFCVNEKKVPLVIHRKLPVDTLCSHSIFYC